MMPIPITSAISDTSDGRRAARPAHPGRTRLLRGSGVAALTALALTAAGCGSSHNGPGSVNQNQKPRFGGTYTILANTSFGVADPAQNYTLEEWQLLIDTHDGLVGFNRVGGPAGNKIVPDLATSIPLPTNGGKTYVFQVRRGIKFS